MRQPATMPSIKRRTLCRSLAAGTLGLALAPLSGPLLRAAPAATALTDKISILSGLGGNILSFNGRDQQVLVDSGSPQHSASLLSELEALTGNSHVDVLLNSHWHDEQTGGNEILGSKGATIIAHEKTQLRLQTDYYLPEEDRYRKALPAAAHPVRSFLREDALDTGDEQISFGYLRQPHTDGDIYVRFQNSNVIAVGDALSPEIDPSFDWFGGGWIGGRLDSLKLLQDISDADTRFVPSYGQTVGRDYLNAELELMQFLYDRMVDMIRMGYTPEDMLSNGLMDNLPRTFNDPYRFVYDANKGLWAHHNKLEPNIV